MLILDGISVILQNNMRVQPGSFPEYGAVDLGVIHEEELFEEIGLVALFEILL